MLVKVYYVGSSLPSPLPLDESMFVFKIQCISNKEVFQGITANFLIRDNLNGFRVLCMFLLQGFKPASAHSLFHLVIYRSFTNDSVHFPRAGAVSRS